MPTVKDQPLTHPCDMKTLSQTHHAVDAAQHAGHNAVNAANPADNARHVPEFEIINLSSGKRVVALTQSGIHQCYVTRPSLPGYIVDFVASAPRLKRERDELLAAAQHLLLSINDEPALRRLIADSCPQASENLYNAIARIEKGGAA